MIYHLSHRDTVNVGDLYSAPALYLQLPGAPQPGPRWVRELCDARLPIGADAIVGGGGFVRHHQLTRIARQARRLVVWGAGDNVHDGRPAPRHAALPREALVGIRDWPPVLTVPGPAQVQWVPCASCLHPAFEEFRGKEPVRAAVAYEHYEHPIPAEISGLPKMTNAQARRLREVLAFLSSADLVVTNSYHGMYWSILLNRRVVVYPLSTRHRRSRYSVPLLGAGDDWRRGGDGAARYPSALAECRRANRLFAAEVERYFAGEDLLGAPGTDPDPAGELAEVRK